jgi:excisionase family DNA binding protein
MIDLAALDVDAVPVAELPALIVELAALQQRAAMRIRIATASDTPPGPSQALDVGDVAQRTGMSRGWLYREARAGRLPFARRLGRRVVFDEAALRRWLERRR